MKLWFFKRKGTHNILYLSGVKVTEDAFQKCPKDLKVTNLVDKYAHAKMKLSTIGNLCNNMLTHLRMAS